MLRYGTSGWSRTAVVSKDARMLHVLYGPPTTVVLRERVDYV